MHANMVGVIWCKATKIKGREDFEVVFQEQFDKR